MSLLTPRASSRFQPRSVWPLRLLIALLALVGVRLWQTSQQPQPPEQLSPGDYAVERVIDGDTLLLANQVRVRLIGVDCPESARSQRAGSSQLDDPWSAEATEFSRRVIGRNKIRLEFDRERIDKYGRFLAYVYYGDAGILETAVPSTGGTESPRMLNEELLRAGLGRALLKHHYSSKMQRRFEAAQREAREARRGIWSTER